MKINFAGTQLCSGQGTDSPQQFSYTGERTEQVSKFLRGVQAVVRDRGNEYTDISFSLFKPQLNAQAAEYFVISARISLPTYGILTMVCDDGSGTKQRSLFLGNALFKRVKARYEGSLAFVDYTFTGGAVSATKPTS